MPVLEILQAKNACWYPLKSEFSQFWPIFVAYVHVFFQILHAPMLSFIIVNIFQIYNMLGLWKYIFGTCCTSAWDFTREKWMLIPCQSKIFSVLAHFRRLVSMHSFLYSKHPCYPPLKFLFSNSTTCQVSKNTGVVVFLPVLEMLQAKKHVDTLSNWSFLSFGPFL